MDIVPLSNALTILIFFASHFGRSHAFRFVEFETNKLEYYCDDDEMHSEQSCDVGFSQNCVEFANNACPEVFIHCPQSPHCTECTILCSSAYACQEATIRSYECDTVTVTALAKNFVLKGATIYGPENGVLSLDISGSESTESHASGIQVFAKDSSTVEVDCEGDCSNSVIYCPINQLDSVNCNIHCERSESVCSSMVVYTEFGVEDVTVWCRGDQSVCSGSTVYCGFNYDDGCDMMHTGSTDWECVDFTDDGKCTFPTNEPTSYPTSTPSAEPSSFPTYLPTMEPTNSTELSSTIARSDGDTLDTLQDGSNGDAGQQGYPDGQEDVDGEKLTQMVIFVGSAIVGVLLFIIAVSWYLCCLRRRKKKEKDNANMEATVNAEQDDIDTVATDQKQQKSTSTGNGSIDIVGDQKDDSSEKKPTKAFSGEAKTDSIPIIDDDNADDHEDDEKAIHAPETGRDMETGDASDASDAEDGDDNGDEDDDDLAENEPEAGEDGPEVILGMNPNEEGGDDDEEDGGMNAATGDGGKKVGHGVEANALFSHGDKSDEVVLETEIITPGGDDADEGDDNDDDDILVMQNDDIVDELEIA